MGRLAFEWVQANPIQIDLLLTDVVMRRVTGPELADSISRLSSLRESNFHVWIYRRNDGKPARIESPALPF